MGRTQTEWRMEIRMLREPDTAAWLRLRVRALRDHPDAFGRAAEDADRALRVAGIYHDEEHMLLHLG
ncbi:MAG: hypothetical protein ACREM3_21085 [Candidatus Rokuibacteriota bacterium]